MATRISVMQDLESDFVWCYICGKPASDLHHCLHGTANRQICDRYRLTVALCRSCHGDLHDRGKFDLELKQKAQKVFEERYGTRQDFINTFGKSFL